MKIRILLFASLLTTFCSFISHAGETNTVTPQAATNSMNDISAKVEAGYSNFIPVVSNRVGTIYGPAVANGAVRGLASVETNVLTALTNSALPELGAASQFLLQLKKVGRLPGVPKDSHGNVSADNIPLSELQDAKYPFAVTFNVVISGDSFTNHYTVLRASKDAAWQLEKAWRTDTRGHMVVEWPAK